MKLIKRIFKSEPKSVLEQDPGQLLQVLAKIKSDPKIYPEIVKQLTERNPIKFKSERETQRYIESATTYADALGVAKLIDNALGSGTFRTLSFLDDKQDSAVTKTSEKPLTIPTINLVVVILVPYGGPVFISSIIVKLFYQNTIFF
jgi:hypothetical protein